MIEWLAGHGVTEVVLACGFLPDVLREALAGEEERAGVSIRYVVEPERRGTAGAIRFAADELGDELDERFLALNGDVLTDLDLTALLGAHARARGAGDARPAPGRGLLRLRPGRAAARRARCSSSSRRRASRSPGEINAGMYVLERSVLDLIPPGEEVSIERDVFPRLVGDGLHGLRLDGYWMDIGTPERYLQASWDILERRVETRVEPTAPGMLSAPGAEVAAERHASARAPCSAAAAGSSRAPRSATRCCSTAASVGAGARVSGSILSAGVEVAAGDGSPRTVRSCGGANESRLRAADARRRPRHPRPPARRPLAGRVGAPRAGRGGRPDGLRDGRLGDRRRPRRRRARRPAHPAAADRARLRAAELGDPGVDGALLQLLGQYRGDAGLLRRRRGARRAAHRRQHRRRARRRRPRGGRAGDRAAGDPAAARRGRLHVRRSPPRSRRWPASRRASTPRSTPPPPSSPSSSEDLQARAAEIAERARRAACRSSSAPT